MRVELDLNELLSKLSCKNKAEYLEKDQNDFNQICLVNRMTKKELNNYQLQIASHLCNGFYTLNSFPIVNIYRYATGIKQFDDILKSGIPSNKITELIGLSNSGKSTFCQYLIEFIIINKLPSKILYIDSGNSFSYEKIINKLNLNQQEIQFFLKQIKHIIVKNPLELQFALFNIEEYFKMQSQIENYLIIIDSFSKIMYPITIPEYCHNLINIQNKFRQFNQKNIGILVVNQQKQMTYNFEQNQIKSVLITPWTIGSAHQTINISKIQQQYNQFEFTIAVPYETSSIYPEFVYNK